MDLELFKNCLNGLLIIFIIAIAFANFFCLLKLVKSGGILRSPRRWLLTTLSGGDLLLALFSLVVVALQVFGDDNTRLECSDIVNGRVYAKSFLPYVYSISLITLCGELLKRKQIQTSFSSPFLACLLVAAIPWVSALVIILPLNLAGFNGSNCRYDISMDRRRAIVIISMLLPAVFACIMAIYTSNNKVADPQYEVYGDHPGTSSGVVISAQMQHPQPQTSNMQPIQIMQQQQEPQQQLSYMQTNYPPVNANIPQQPNQPPQYLQPQYQQSLQQPPVIVQPPMVAQPPTVAMTTYQPSRDLTDVAQHLKREQRAIVRVLMVHFVLTLPFVLYYLCYVYNDNKADLTREQIIVIANGVEFLLYARSFFTPLIWSHSLK